MEQFRKKFRLILAGSVFSDYVGDNARLPEVLEESAHFTRAIGRFQKRDCIAYAEQLPRFLIDTKNCGTRGGWAWRLLKVTAPRLLASDVPTAAPRATLSLDVNVARAGDDYDSGDVQ